MTQRHNIYFPPIIGKKVTATSPISSFRYDYWPSSRQGQSTLSMATLSSVAGVRYRLYGIDAPEKNQTCLTGDGVRWACGKEAGKALIHKITNHPVTCKGKKRGIYHRVISVCYANGVNLNAWMVSHGWAVA